MNPTTPDELHVAIIRDKQGSHALTAGTHDELRRLLHNSVKARWRHRFGEAPPPDRDPSLLVEQYFGVVPDEDVLVAVADGPFPWSTQAACTHGSAGRGLHAPYSFAEPRCPSCDRFASGLLESQNTWADLVRRPDGFFEYGDGSDGDEFEQEPVVTGGSLSLRCKEEHHWTTGFKTCGG